MPLAPGLQPEPLADLPGRRQRARGGQSGSGGLPRRPDARRRERPDHGRDERTVREVDEVVDVRAPVQADGVATGVDEQGERDGQVELARIPLAATSDPPGEGSDQQAAGVAHRAQPAALAVIPRRVGVEEGVDRQADHGRLGDRDGGDPRDVAGRGRRDGRCHRSG